MRSLRPILLSWLWILVTANNENDLETIDELENQNGTVRKMYIRHSLIRGVLIQSCPTGA